MNDSELIDKAQGIARSLSYNDKAHGPVKHTLHELCHRLGAKTLSVHTKDNGLSVATCYGKTRCMTLGERILHRLFGVVPPIDGWRGDKR